MVGNVNAETIGCIEVFCSMKRLKDKMAKIQGQKEITGQEMHQILQNPTKETEKIITEYIQSLNIGLTNYINIFEPEVICFRRKLCTL